MKLEEFCSKLKEILSDEPSAELRLEAAAKYVGLAFSTKPDEVAFFQLDEEAESLSFIWPAKLKSAGTVPLSAASPLVAITARENRGFINNSFAATPHSSFFELFRIDGTKPLPIQKIMSVAYTEDGKVKGVIQVSRKGADPATAGNDFSHNDLIALQRMSTIIADYI
jgi:hypothetical protein